LAAPARRVTAASVLRIVFIGFLRWFVFWE
jgi:hypothetical protein